MKDIEKFEKLHNLVLNNGLFLGLDFKYKNHSQFYDNLAGQVYVIELVNQKREIRISICIADKEAPLVHVLNIIISNIDNISDDDEPWFSLGDWMRAVGKPKDEMMFLLESYKGNYEEKLKSFFNFLDKLFEDENLRKILKGEAWGYFPFDWGNMK